MDILLRLATLPYATAYHWRMPGAGRRNPDWEWDEIVLACDLVAQYYGERGRGYIECHHVQPLHVTGQREVSIRELALLCSNCHRMIHTKPPWLTLDELREIIKEAMR
jgi:predicted HNH restriction endonuclease